MQMLTIEAASLESAHRLYSTLSVFHPELLTGEGGYQVSVAVASVSNMLSVLDAIEQQVVDRGDGPALLDLDGHRYTLHAR